MRFDDWEKENILRGGRGRAKPRYARAICSMQREWCKDKKKAPRRREFSRKSQYLSHLLHSIWRNLASSVIPSHLSEVSFVNLGVLRG
jgi:hypothetical protein